MAKEKTELIRKVSAVLTTQLVPNPVAALVRGDVPVGAMLYGFDPSDPLNESMVLACDDRVTREWTQHVSEPFLLHAWAAKKVLLKEREDRPEREAVKIWLIDPEGDTLSFTSEGVLGSLDMIRALRGDGPFDPPIKTTVVPIKTDETRTMFKLRIERIKPLVVKK
jgi:hypothetical protein